MNSVTTDDAYEGDFDASRRVLTWQLDFTVKGYLFGPINKQKFIISVTAPLYADVDATQAESAIISTGNTADFSTSNSVVELPGPVVDPFIAP